MSKKPVSTLDWLDDPLTVIEPSDMITKQSAFGNGFYFITKDQLEELSQGKVLFDMINNEYGIFIGMKK